MSASSASNDPAFVSFESLGTMGAAVRGLKRERGVP
jgi:hypothetical protein